MSKGSGNNDSYEGPWTPPTPGEDCYVFNMDQLRSGDVILTRSPGQVVSEVIRIVTASDYSHAMLVLDPPYCIESSDYGVVKFTLNRFGARDLENILVLRVPDITPEQCDKIVQYASCKVTSEYADNDALKVPLPLHRTEFGKYFCSQLVAEAYAVAGLPLTELLPEKTSPGDLADSFVLAKLDSRLLFRFQAASSAHFQYALLDGHNQMSPAEQESILKQGVCADISKHFASIGINVSTFHAALGQFIKLLREKDQRATAIDRPFASAIYQSGLLQLTSKRFPPYSDEFFLDLYLKHAIVLGQYDRDKLMSLVPFYISRLATMSSTNTERKEDAEALKQLYEDTGSETIRLYLALTWEAFLTGKRMQSAMEQAQKILNIHLHQ